MIIRSIVSFFTILYFVRVVEGQKKSSGLKSKYFVIIPLYDQKLQPQQIEVDADVHSPRKPHAESFPRIETERQSLDEQHSSFQPQSSPLNQQPSGRLSDPFSEFDGESRGANEQNFNHRDFRKKVDWPRLRLGHALAGQFKEQRTSKHVQQHKPFLMSDLNITNNNSASSPNEEANDTEINAPQRPNFGSRDLKLPQIVEDSNNQQNTKALESSRRTSEETVKILKPTRIEILAAPSEIIIRLPSKSNSNGR
ncbi:hypothetical protein M3Y95_01142600 [Aphelenchoides besseyi]|nr:hypothetical protein M3Y95_01142600 [Aphelenchoides besseyi]